MQASTGDVIEVEAHTVGRPHRTCTVLEVRGTDGGPPYLVQWNDRENPSLYFPGTDAQVRRSEESTGPL
jgi:hypothetical protein